MGARAGAERGGDPRRAPSRDGRVGRAGSGSELDACAARAAVGGCRQSARRGASLVMGIPGAGKSAPRRGLRRARLRAAQPRRARRFAARARRRARRGARRPARERVVLDNTYLTRAARSYVVEAAGAPRRRGALRLDRHAARAGAGQPRRAAARPASARCPRPSELRALARKEPGLLAPTSQMRSVRELEPPSPDEGFAAIEHVPFVREPHPERTARGRVRRRRRAPAAHAAIPRRRTSSSTGVPTAAISSPTRARA